MLHDDPHAGRADATPRLPTALRDLFRRRRTDLTVEITDEGIARSLGDGRVEAVTWDELTEVRILTTSDGPWADDVFFVLVAGEHGCVVAQSFASEDFVRRLQSLPGFDNEQMIEAMGSVSEAQFSCWRRA